MAISNTLRKNRSDDDIAEIREAEETLKKLTARLFRLQEDERKRIARDLHDVTAQNLFAISINLSLLEKNRHLRTTEGKNILSECRVLCEQSLQEIRTLSYLLHPPLLDKAGLISALQWYVDGFVKRSGIFIDVFVMQNIGRLPAELEDILFRVVQESLMNVYRHSGSGIAQIKLEKDETQIILRVMDQGSGILRIKSVASLDPVESMGVGIPGMRQRLEQLGGKLEILSTNRGTTISAIVPLPEE